MNTHDSPIPLQVRVNLVPVRVVVRDSQGHAVPNLRKEDFRILEDGKPQVISVFSAETPAISTAEVTATAPGAGDSPQPPAFRPASRFAALIFDDVHLQFGDLVQARNAAGRFIDVSLQPGDRAAIFTISGQSQTDFTDDRPRLHETLKQLQPRPVSAGDATNPSNCPSMDYYEADLIVNQQDMRAIDAATADALVCAFGGNGNQSTGALALARSTAMMVLHAGNTQTEYSVRRLREIVTRLSALAGQRTIVFVSPGFWSRVYESDVAEIVDRAVRTNVVINTLDARGLYTVNVGPDISQPFTGDVRTAWIHSSNHLESAARQSDVLLELAYGTAGFFYHNSNDLDAGFRAVGGRPEVSYHLGFAPQTLKYDGKFHSLKVTLTTKEKYVVQARGGFYAPKRSETPADIAKQDIEEAVLSQEVQRGLPIELHTQFYKINPTDAKLAVMAHVGIGPMQFQKADGRNRNELTVVAALFDRNGNYVTGSQKVVEMRLRDATLQRLEREGLTVKSSFNVKAGGYFVRLVVREANAALLSTQNGVVEIPY
jgi:VWFA-related protein